MSDADDVTLPEGWRWATNIHDVAKGLAVSKVWWRNGKPFIRVKLYSIEAVAGPGAIRGTIEVAEASRNRVHHGAGVSKAKYTMQWVYIMDVPEMPNEPTAAAVSFELDYPTVERTVLQHVTNLWCEHG